MKSINKKNETEYLGKMKEILHHCLLNKRL